MLVCVSQLHPSVSFPVTIDGFLCLPAHKGSQGVKWTDRGTERWCPSCLSVCPNVWVSAWVCESIYKCVQVWKLRPGTSLAGELMKTSVLDQGQISTSVMLAVVTDSQTLRMSPSLTLFPKTKSKYLVSVTSLSGAPGQATCCRLLCGCVFG